MTSGTTLKDITMARQIIKQPNGEYCIFSTIVDHFVAIDLTSKELIDFYRNERGLNGELEAERIMEIIENDEKPYFQFTKTFDEAMQDIKDNHGGFVISVDSGEIYENHFYE
jgi:hypothetical protein